jgi:DNA-directed RNA polymerase specialized sigma24 family protein
VTAEAREHLLDYIAQPATRSSLHAYVRRRGLGDSADDVVQTVLCDALAAQVVPERSSELPRFLTGIARNKVVDEQRRRARWKRAELPDDLEAPKESEARQLLRRIQDDVVEPEERRALGWLVREHAGDSLYLLALEQALAPSTLRQRICRLRKSLRLRYLAPLALALALGTGWAAFHAEGAAAPVAGVTSAALAPYAGNWRVIDVEPAKYRTLGLSVRIDGAKVGVFGGGEQLGSVVIEQASGESVTLRSGKSVWNARLERISTDQLRLTTSRGFVELKRAP